jgi:hypothetical protein
MIIAPARGRPYEVTRATAAAWSIPERNAPIHYLLHTSPLRTPFH